MRPFPAAEQKQRSNSFIGIPKEINIKTRCACQMPEFVDNMTNVRTKKCKKWYNNKCIGCSQGESIEIAVHFIQEVQCIVTEFQ